MATGYVVEEVGLRSSSVMDEMSALFAPPGRESKLKSRTELHPYFKRPGKGHNHDSCDACGEGGDLICCDNCPASFHFSCHSPPLEEEDIPMGDWICLRCYHKEQMRIAAANASFSSNMVGIKPSEPEVVPVQPPKKKGGKSKAKKPDKSGSSTEKKVKIYRIKYEKYLRAKPVTGSPFDALIAASQIMNAEQFNLPNELKPNENLPFSWKWADERQDDFDTYPKNCSVCRKTSRGVPTVGCDFCASAYHLDCLDPPLCEIPKERWMCPNHVENFVDTNLVSTTSLTERLKLWNKHARAPVNQEAVRLEFFRKVRTGKLYQKSRLKTEKPPDLRIKVPSFVKQHYAHPIKGFPVERQPEEDIKVDKPKASPKRTEDLSEEQDEWLRQLVALQTGILKHQMSKEEVANQPLTSSTKKSSLLNGRLSPRPGAVKGVIESDNGSITSNSTASECSLGMDEDDQLSADVQAELCGYLSRQKSRFPDVQRLDPTIKDFLAMQRMRELFSSSSISGPLDPNQVQARAALVPISNPKCREPCPIRRRSVDIGLGSTVGIDLSQIGHCNLISAKHATIFYDQYSRVYELINYSQHGTIVDNIVYSLDLKPDKLTPKLTTTMNAETKATDKSCHCTNSVGEIAHSVDHGCETSAVLHHGSFIRFGCLQFAFCVVDYQEQPQP